MDWSELTQYRHKQQARVNMAMNL